MSEEKTILTYEAAGVDYGVLDRFKRACQKAAVTTAEALHSHGFAEPEKIRGESCYLFETPDGYIAHVEEALGTKIKIADAMLELTGKSYYRNVAIDDVATIVNDMATSGALPTTVAMYAAVGDDAFFSHPQRAMDLAEGFAEGCKISGATWSGGETQTLAGMITKGTCVLGGSAVGYVSPKSQRVPCRVEEGDNIIFLSSSGVQTNGLTLCRAVAERASDGYLSHLIDGRTYGEALLDPSVIYVAFVAACQKKGIALHYNVHMTGHGWRKLMRLDEPFVYRITTVPDPHPIFQFIADHARLNAKQMYETFNMGVGWATFVAERDVQRCLEVAQEAGYTARRAGEVIRRVDETTGRRQKAVDIVPLGIHWDGSELNIRGTTHDFPS